MNFAKAETIAVHSRPVDGSQGLTKVASDAMRERLLHPTELKEEMASGEIL